MNAFLSLPPSPWKHPIWYLALGPLSDSRPVFNPPSQTLPPAMLHIMTPVGIFLLLAPFRDETNVLNGHARKVGLATIGGGTPCVCSEE